jgi:hypothetical protein
MGQWFGSFRDAAWSKAVGLAPAMVERCRKLWNGVAQRPARAAPSAAPEEPASADALPALEVQVHSLGRRAKQLEEEAASSFEVVRAIAEQHSQLAEQQAALVDAVQLLLARTRALFVAIGLVALAVVALLIVVVRI